jgi:4-alpha-glucanotransferase
MSGPCDLPREPVRDALRRLGKRRLVLAIHDASFPSLAEQDLGRGSPYSGGGLALARLAHGLGFDALQLGPPGQTSRDNASPYDGTFFSRNVLSLDLFELAAEPGWAGLIPRKALEAAVVANPARGAWRTAHRHAFDAVHGLLGEAWLRFREARAQDLASVRPVAEALAEFRRRSADWIERDALYEAIAEVHGGRYFGDWPHELDRRLYARSDAAGAEARALRRSELLVRHAEAIERYAFGQLAVHAQHERFREALRPLGLALFGDLQVGASPTDLWGRAAVFLPGYRLGAPPSRTNPEGQPWGYGVLDPELYRADGGPGPVLAFLRAQAGKMMDEHDGLRVDHPHGLICPWVYRAEAADPLRAVQAGARLFSSPHLPDHPELARHAIARLDQLDLSLPRHADGWVRELEPGQVERYAVLLDAVVGEFRARVRDPADLACEVLSTMPYPLGRVLERHGLGRFRVTQKADLDEPRDVYRSENARPEDWVMAGTHDTPPLARVAAAWSEAELRRQAAYLAGRLGAGRDREAFARELAEDRRKLFHAKVADLFVCPARQVVVFFADLFGLHEVYNTPGTVSEDNWSLRLPPDFEARYRQRAGRGEALDLCRALALALRARSAWPEDEALACRLEERSLFRD